MPPTKNTTLAAHALVGLAALVLAPKLLGRGAGARVAVMLFGILAHAALDAPVAKGLASAGVQL